MIVEEDAPTSVGQAHDGALADLRIMRRPENVTEANLAEVFAAYLQGKALYCFDDKQWYLWNGQRWQKDKQNRIILKAEAFVRQATKMAIDAGEPDIARRILGFLSAQKLDNLVKLAKLRLAVNLADFDADPMQLCVENGVIDLATGKLLDPNPAMRHSKVAGVSYDANAKCPRFMQFLKDIFPDDLELRGYAQKMIGYTMTGSTKEQCLFMFLGGGANGKSTLVNVLTKLMGDYAANTAASTLMASNSNQVGDDLIRLAGARYITAAETEHGQRFAEAKIKSFTGGDMISASPLYGEWVDFQPIGKIFLTTNNRPEIRGSDDGIWRRMVEVPFNRQFTADEQDKELMAALLQELPGILNWAIEGCLHWQTEGLIAPQSVTASVTEYRTEIQPVASI